MSNNKVFDVPDELYHDALTHLEKEEWNNAYKILTVLADQNYKQAMDKLDELSKQNI